MAIKRLLHNAVHFKEFQNDPVTGHHYVATCGETALATAMVTAMAAIEDTAQAINLMTSMTREMMALHWADSPNGATQTFHLHDEAIRRGFKVDQSHYIRWEQPIPDGTLHPWLLDLAGIKPIVLMVEAAGAGLTAIDGSHAERGVHGHFICVVGLADEGYVTMDGDNNEITYKLVIYPFSALHNADVTGFLVIEPQEQNGAHVMAGVPQGWTDDTAKGILSNPVNKFVVVKGFRDSIMASDHDPNDVPVEDEHGDPSESEQTFRFSGKVWTPAGGVQAMNVGERLLAALAHVVDLQAQLAKATAPVADPVAEQCKAAIQALVAAMKQA